MKLVSVTIQNFRSISTARRIPIAQLTTLVGPNNEGKSNILRALVIATNSLIDKRPGNVARVIRASAIGRRRRRRQDRYNWITDCPLKLQAKSPSNGSTITLEFDLTPAETEEFQTSIGSKLNGTLPISFSFTRDSEEVTIPKQGRGQKVLNSKANRIAAFIAGKIEIQYIPAVRTAESSQAIVDELVSGELEKIEADSRYQQALADIAALQEPVLEDLSKKIAATMQEFLPNITQTRILIPEDDRSVALRGLSEINVDDGAETPLEYKGDGVQSLAAIALMRHVSQMQHQGKDVLIALEEPESHLHPMAIRQLRNVLMELSTRHQVVVTTHNPIFTNRSDVHQNIIVSKNRAYPADSVKEVRSVLRVRLDDNLSSAEIALIVEGEEDRIALRGILSSMDKDIDRELRAGRVAIDVLGGAGNLTHRIRLHTEAMCKVHVFLDDDNAGRTAFDKARDEGVIDAGGVNFSRVGGKIEGELEDMYDEKVYQGVLTQETGLQLINTGPDSNKKWSDRLRSLLRKGGKPLDEITVLAIKVKVANAAAAAGIDAVHQSKRGPIESLRNALKSKLGEGKVRQKIECDELDEQCSRASSSHHARSRLQRKDMRNMPTWTAAELTWGHGPRVFEMFLEPTCPFSNRALGKIKELLATAGEDKITVKVRLQSQPWHLYSGVIVRAILAASTLENGREAAWRVMVAVAAHREEFEFEKHCTGPNRTATPNDIIARIERTSGVQLAAAFDIPDLDRAIKMHCRYARQNGIHVSPSFMIDGLVQPDIGSGDAVSAWAQRLVGE